MLIELKLGIYRVATEPGKVKNGRERQGNRENMIKMREKTGKRTVFEQN